MRDVMFLGAFAAYLPFALRYPFIGAMLWAWAAFFSPADYLYGFMTLFPISKIIAGVSVVAVLVSREKKIPYVDGLLLLMAAFLAQATISALYGGTLLSLNWDLWSKMAKIMVLAAIMTLVLTDRRRVQYFVLAICLGLAFNGADEGLKVLITAGGHRVLGILAYGDNNQFAVAMLMGVPLLIFLHATSTHRVARAAFLVCIVLSIVSVVGTFSRGGFIGLGVVALGFVAQSRRRVRNLMLVAACGGVLLLAAPSSWFDRIGSIDQAQSDDSFMGRIVAWKISTLIALDRPLTGGGLHAVQDPAMWTHYAQNFDDLAFIPTPPPGDVSRAAHSIYFEVLGDTGFLGLGVFCALLAAGLHACGRLRRATRRHPELAWAHQLAGMLRLSLLAYVVAGAALSMAYFELLYVLLALVSVVGRLVRVELSRRADALVLPAASWAT